MSKIDVHAHVVPPIFREALQLSGGDPAGWHIPDWSPEGAIKVQDELNVRTSVLSVTTPGCLFLDQPGNRKLARDCNEYCAKIRHDFPGRFGFYVNLSNPRMELQECLDEIRYGLDTLDGDGVCLLTQYNGSYLGDPHFIPLWEELNKRRASVLIHPTPPFDYRPIPHQKYCPCPLFDFPHETTRTVSDIIMSGRRREFPDVKIVLCHGGGTIPYIADRIAMLSAASALQNPLSPIEILRQFKTFYYDTALCGTEPAFDTTVNFALETNLVIGSDHPYAVSQAMMTFAEAVDNRNWSEEQRDRLYVKNAAVLFPRLVQRAGL